MIDSVFRTGINYYPQGFLGECKYVVKGKEISISIFLKYYWQNTNFLWFWQRSFDKESSSEKNSIEENSDQEN